MRIAIRKSLPVAATAVAVCVGLLVVSEAVRAGANATLPRDPNNVYGQFDNGMKYIIRKNANPPGKVALNLHIDTGALNETDQQNGLAHFIEHMAFNGSTHFEPGELIPLWNRMGMVFGADSNAHTTYNETVYKLTMPDTKPETLDLAFTIFADFANGLTLTDKEIDEERGVILEESRGRKSADERLQKQVMKQVFSDTRLAVHDVIGDEGQIKTFPRSEFTDYWNTWYRPENMTLVVVGDINPEEIVAHAKAKLGEFKARTTAREPLKAGFKPSSDAPRAFIFSDPEQVACEVEFLTMHPGRPPVTTVEQFRQELVDGLANWIVNRRFDDLVSKGDAPFRDASASNSNFMNEVQMVQAQAEGESKDWNKMLDATIAEINRAIDHGFTASELALAKSGTLAAAERAVQTESTRDSTSIVAQLSSAVGRERPILSAEQRLELVKQILDTVTTDELHRAFVENFKTRNYTYLLTVPPATSGEKQPTTDDILAAASAAWARKTEAPEESKLAGSILASEPEAGKVVSRETDKDLNLTTSTFANGVVMHHKFTDYKKDAVQIKLTLPGGRIEETADNKGVSDVASLILQRPATSRFTSTQIRDLMTGKSVAVSGGLGIDSLSIGIAGSNEDLSTGMQLAFALLTDGALEQSSLDEWKKNRVKAYEQMQKMPEGQLGDAISDTVFASDVRLTPLTPDVINRQERSPAEAWFKRIAGHSAIEVAVVGDIKLEDAEALVAKYVGSLPKRQGDFTDLSGLRRLDRGPGPYAKTVKMQTVTPKALVLAGFISCDDMDPERRPLSLASLIISDRMIEKLREKEQLVYSIGANNQPGRGIPGTGMMMAAAPTDPRNADRLADEIIVMFKEFAAKGPTDEELSIAKKQIANQLETQMKEPSFWLGQIGEMTYRDRPISDLKQLPQIYNTFTAAQVQEAVAKYFHDDSVVRIVIEPESTGAPTTAPASHEPAMK